MAKYTNGHDMMYECEKCLAHLELHHFQRDGYLSCPECQGPTFFHYDKCEMMEEMPLTAMKGGIFFIRYQGEGMTMCPPVLVEEKQWMPQQCPLCDVQVYAVGQPDPIHFVHRVKLFDATRCFSVQDNPMYGVDIVPDGSQVAIPFMSPSRIWISGKEINYSNFRNDSIGGWEYFL